MSNQPNFPPHECDHAFRIGSDELDYCRICYKERDGHDFRNWVASQKQLAQVRAQLKASEERAGRLEEALQFISGGCLVPPDGGSPNLQDAIDSARQALALDANQGEKYE